ncbi:beta-ketoacyl synthase N-terminal-like domain-containing protein [Spirillospora sp. CA-294931]|uniref:beta-ketoacyl synthase N-terminal-like domain-containing protein n=1 Tax=Spirillospora sp. CA-294931 TaxID=3240042 RepID=UPI003D92CFA8
MIAGAAVAIVGMACRFPGAPGKEEFWDLVVRGQDAIGPVPESRWPVDDFYSSGGEPGTINTRMGGFIHDLDRFDNELFGIPEDEAAAMDPQQRLLLECAWHTVEDAGLDPAALAGTRTGVYVGVTGNDWLWEWAASGRPADFAARQGGGMGHHLMANRLSHQLDLRGPSVAVDTESSASLVAVHLAATAVAQRECDYALAAGVNVILSPAGGIYQTQAGLSAPSGRPRPFSALAEGSVRGEGVGMVVLRRLDSALVDGQPVYAVIRGSAVGHHGRGEGLTVPGWRQQQETIMAAYERAGVTPAEIAFVEANGTGAPLGDAAEAAALGAVHGVPRGEPCAIGSVKGNLGHLEGAAGIASLIKTALALHHRVVPPSLYGVPEDPRHRLGENGLRLLDRLLRLPGDDEVVAGVGAMGTTGTIAHVVLGMVRPVHGLTPPPGQGAGVFTLSAPDHGGLRRNLAAQATYLEGCRDDELGAICFTSNKVKGSLRHRFVAPADSMDELVGLLREAVLDTTLLGALTGDEQGGHRFGLLLPGAEAWPAGTPTGVAEGPEPFRAFLDEAAQEARVAENCLDLYDHQVGGWTSGAGGVALFCIEYALGKALQALRLTPAFVAGRGVGALAASCLAGAVSLSEALRSLVGLAPQSPPQPPRIPVLVAGDGDDEGEWFMPSGHTGEPQGGAGYLVRVGPADAFAARVERGLRQDGAVPRVLAVGTDAGADLLRLVADLSREGFDVDWEAVYALEHRVVHRLAPYAFARTEFPVRAGKRS